jgi:hypothetical protein
VLRAPVPETAVDEHGDAQADEGDVDPAPKPGQRVLDAVSDGAFVDPGF